MASVETWQSEHEKVCGDRYQLLMRVIAAGVTVLIAVASFGLANLYSGQQEQMRLLRDAVQIHSVG
jgi:hypothetical protein